MTRERCENVEWKAGALLTTTALHLLQFLISIAFEVQAQLASIIVVF